MTEKPIFKKLLFTISLILIPTLLFLVIAEGLLRLIDYGYDTAPLKKVKVQDEAYWVGNPDFTRLYFPAALKRLPPPNRIPLDKASNKKRFMVVGGSAAAGDPDTDYSIARNIEWLLNTAHPSIEWEIINLAYTACNSHVAREVVRQSGPYQLDGIIVLVGNNEVIGPFGPGTTLTESLPSLASRDFSIFLRKTKLGQFGQIFRENMNAQDEDKKAWRGMQHFLDHRISKSDTRLIDVYENFQANLRDMESHARRKGIPILLSNVPVNLLDHPPFMDNSETLPEEVSKNITAYLKSGTTELSLETVLNSAKNFPTSANLNYMAGRILHEKGKTEKAKEYLTLARDLDLLRFRADSKLNSIIEDEWKRKGTNWIKIDAVTQILNDNPNNALGFPHFYEHVHFSLRANFLIAKEMSKAILEHEQIQSNNLDYIQWTDAASGLAHTAYETFLSLEEIEKRFQSPPFTGITGYERMTQWIDKLRDHLYILVSKAEQKEHMTQSYLRAMQIRPDDDRIKLNFCHFLIAFGRSEAALPMLKELYDKNPTDSEIAISFYQLCIDNSNTKGAQDALNRIEEIFPEHPNLKRMREKLNALKEN